MKGSGKQGAREGVREEEGWEGWREEFRMLLFRKVVIQFTPHITSGQ